MKKTYLNLDFEMIRERIKLDKNRYKPGVWAKMVGVSVNVVSNIHGKTNQNPSLEYIIAVALATGKSVDYYLWGKESEEKFNNLTKVIIEHQDIVKRFKDSERAKNINECLLEIEDLSDDLYNKVDGYIEASRDAARAIKESLKKTPKEGNNDLQDRDSA